MSLTTTRDVLLQRILVIALRAEARRLLDLADRGRKAHEASEAFWRATERASRVLWRLSNQPGLGQECDAACERWKNEGTRVANPSDFVDAVQTQALREEVEATLKGEEDD